MTPRPPPHPYSAFFVMPLSFPSPISIPSPFGFIHSLNASLNQQISSTSLFCYPGDGELRLPFKPGVSQELPVLSEGFKSLQSKGDLACLSQRRGECLSWGSTPHRWDGKRRWYTVVIPAHRVRCSRSPLALWLHRELEASLGYMRETLAKNGGNPWQPAISY